MTDSTMSPVVVAMLANIASLEVSGSDVSRFLKEVGSLAGPNMQETYQGLLVEARVHAAKVEEAQEAGRLVAELAAETDWPETFMSAAEAGWVMTFTQGAGWNVSRPRPKKEKASGTNGSNGNSHKFSKQVKAPGRPRPEMTCSICGVRADCHA